MGGAGSLTALQGFKVTYHDRAVPSFVYSDMAKVGRGLLEGTLRAGTSAVSPDKPVRACSLCPSREYGAHRRSQRSDPIGHRRRYSGSYECPDQSTLWLEDNNRRGLRLHAS